MKKTQRKEIQEKTLAELLADGRNWRQEIFNLRLQQASAQLEKPARLRLLLKTAPRSLPINLFTLNLIQRRSKC